MRLQLRSKGARVALISGTLAAVFMTAGLMKLFGLRWQVDLFHQLGLPHWVLLAVGTVECVGALLLLNHGTRSYGAMGLALVMIGASLAHVMTGVMLPLLFVNAVLCFAAGWLVLSHRPRFLQVRHA